jgi:ring-1,2-phenylacetyl-CoA epoxidase subunit PaaE
MSVHFHSLTISKINRETPDCVSISFSIPPNLSKEFQFKQGQTIAVKTKINNQDIRRNYSICSSPLDNELKIAVKRIADGIFSNYANDALKVGDTLEVFPPTGKFYTELNEKQEKKYLAIAAGSGITPILSIIKTTLAIESKSEFTLMLGNKTRQSIIFLEELEALKNKYLTRFNLIHVLSQEKTEDEFHNGRIDSNKLASLQKIINISTINEIFICGPQELVIDTEKYFTGLGIASKNIHKELFTAKTTAKAAATKQNFSKGDISQITITVDGRQTELELSTESEESILDAAIKKGADLPYACKGGMCCTCKAKLIEGEVSMDVHWGLEEDEIKNGFILTCQSHPRTKRVVIDFDCK